MRNSLETGSPLLFRQVIRTALVVLVIISILSYALYQARLLLTGPEISLTEPVPVVHDTRVVEVAGLARNITTITINGRPMYTDESGYFKEAIVLENGYTITTLEAVDRYGRHTRIELPLVYQPQSRLPL